jgi:AraC-like DNA-binding protein
MPRKPAFQNALEDKTFTRAASVPTPWMAPVFQDLQFVIVNRNLKNGQHRHTSEFEVVAMEQGTYGCRVNDIPLLLSPGDMLVVKPGDFHSDDFIKGSRFTCMRFHLEPGFLSAPATALFRPGISPQQQLIRIDRRVFWPLFHRLEAETRTQSPFAGQIQDTLIEEFIWRLVRLLPQESVHPEIIGYSEERGFRAELLRLFHLRLREGLSVGEMAAHLNLSESVFAHRCKRLMGQAPAFAFMQSKMAQAQRMLQGGIISVKAVSAFFGFENPSHFSRVFKRHLGITPTMAKQR